MLPLVSRQRRFTSGSIHRSEGISYSLGSEAPNKTTLAIVNNKFVEWTNGFAIRNTGMSGNAEATVKYNSFISTDRVALEVKTNQAGSGGADSILVTPFLSEAHPMTPQ